jgi:putative NIF3 family GTP cyclohydrolase 1 type 2
VLAQRLGIVPEARPGPRGDAGVRGPLVGTVAGTFAEFVARAAAERGVRPDAWRNTAAFGRVALATGGAGLTRHLEAAAARGCDTYMTGEGGMYTKLYAREAGVNLVFGTHYATEKHGVRAWAARVADRFGLPWTFVAEDADIL